MPTFAVKVTNLNDARREVKQGILVTNPQVGKNCLIYLGAQKYLTIYQVKGWIGPANRNYIILFDSQNKRFHIEAFASSDQFLS